jgi:hypothetical protein
MNKMRIFVILFFILLAGVVGYLFFLSTKTNISSPKTNESIGTAPREVPPFVDSGIKKSNIPIAFSIQTPDVDMPDTLPTYSVVKPPFVAQQQAVATSLGFNSSSDTLPKAPDARKWTSEAATLTMYSDSQSLSYTARIIEQKAASQNEAARAAQAFLSKTGIVPREISIASSPISFFTIEGSTYFPTSNASVAQITSLALYYTINNRMIYTPQGLRLENGFHVHKGGVIGSARVQFPPIITKTEQKNTIPLPEAKKGLITNKGSFVGITNNKQGESSVLDVSFSDVTIRSQELVYVYDSSSNQLKPAYLFKGVVTKGNSESQGASVSFFVAATYD